MSPREGERERRTRRRAFQTITAAVMAAVATALLLPLSSTAQSQAGPANTSPPTISGNAVKGQTLVGNTGSWTGTAPISFAFTWWRCDSAGGNCGATGATGTTYVLDNADVGTRLRLAVTATNGEGTASVFSDATAIVASGSTPTLATEPRITGSAVVGQRLTATAASWLGAQPIAIARQWVRCGADGGNPDGSNCTNIAGATSTTYVLTTADAGWRLRIRETATNASGSRTAASNPTAAVTGGGPANSKLPSISGTMVEGQTATVAPGSWSGAAPISFGYQWLRCNTGGGSCVAIAGATGQQYKLTSADVGHKVRVNVTARNTAGAGTAMSGESAVIAASGPQGVITLPTGEKSIPVASVPKGERLIVDRVVFTPGMVRSRRDAVSVQVRVKDTRGYVVRDAMVFIRSTPLVTRAGQERRPTLANGYAVFQMTPRANFPTVRRGAVQFFVKAYKNGDNPLAGVAGYRLVQVRIAR